MRVNFLHWSKLNNYKHVQYLKKMNLRFLEKKLILIIIKIHQFYILRDWSGKIPFYVFYMRNFLINYNTHYLKIQFYRCNNKLNFISKRLLWKNTISIGLEE